MLCLNVPAPLILELYARCINDVRLQGGRIFLKLLYFIFLRRPTVIQHFFFFVDHRMDDHVDMREDAFTKTARNVPIYRQSLPPIRTFSKSSTVRDRAMRDVYFEHR